MTNKQRILKAARASVIQNNTRRHKTIFFFFYDAPIIIVIQINILVFYMHSAYNMNMLKIK